MRTIKLLLIALLMVPVAYPQTIEIPTMATIDVPNLNLEISTDLRYTWLDLAARVFPNVMYDDNSLNRSIPIRRLGSTTSSPLKIDARMVLVEFQHYWFESNGATHLAVVFTVEGRYRPRRRYDVLSIYRFKPKLELVDVIDAQDPVWRRGSSQAVGSFAELVVMSAGRRNETIHVVNKEQRSALLALEKHRFLILDEGRLREVVSLPVLKSSRDCGGEVSHLVYFDSRRSPDRETGLPHVTVERQIKPLPECERANDFGITEYETYRLTWKPSTRSYAKRRVQRDAEIPAPLGTYRARSFKPHRTVSRVKIGEGYRATATYDPNTGKLRIPNGRDIEFEDYWSLLPLNARGIVHATIDFQIIREETRYTAKGYPRSTYRALIHGFGQATGARTER